jgi:hypothetical protein
MGTVKRRRAKSEDNGYTVGYGRPPESGRFKHGQSGNPKGRPKGSRNFKTDLKATLDTPVKVTREGKLRKISTQKAMLFRLREKALGGDPRALDRYIALAQMYGDDEPAVPESLSAEDEQILQIYQRRLLSKAIPASESIRAESKPAIEQKPTSDLKKTDDT